MAMLSLSEQCVLHQHHLHDGRPPSSSQPLLLRPHQLRLSLRDVLRDVYNCELIQRRPFVEPLCQVVLRVKDVNRSNSSSEKVAFGTNILYKTAEAFWDIRGQQSTAEQPRSNARIFASLDSDGGKADEARKALEQAFQGKKNITTKWEEEIKKRELSGGDGGSGSGGSGGGGSSWGGGGGGGDEEMGEGFGGQDEPWDWEEVGQTFMATFALTVLYISITHGPKQVFKLFKLFFRYIRQGFRLRKIPDEYFEGIEDDSEEDYEDVSDDEAREKSIDEACERLLRIRRAELSASNALAGDVQNNKSVNDSAKDETEEDEDDDMFDASTTPNQQSKREDLLSKRQAEQKEKLLQLLTPKELRQKEEKK